MTGGGGVLFASDGEPVSMYESENSRYGASPSRTNTMGVSVGEGVSSSTL